MYNYRRNLVIFSVVLLLGLGRSVFFFQGLSTWPQMFQSGVLPTGTLVLLLLCDALTSVGAVVSGIVGICLRKKDKGLIPWSILAFLVCIAFFANAMLLIANSSGEYSNYTSRRGIAYLAALPALQGLCYIGVEKNWAAKFQRN
ncbi:hypothetical protein ACTQ33_11790 [Candidatus Avoscillospira sp. LCP25S3_F1]|uniref:hypothetical protein n=1 Tax=Candidatus Avoscillospira sp. LCP25S3_F1 TaxID=3438825 RepID=UPI003F901378